MAAISPCCCVLCVKKCCSMALNCRGLRCWWVLCVVQSLLQRYGNLPGVSVAIGDLVVGGRGVLSMRAGHRCMDGSSQKMQYYSSTIAGTAAVLLRCLGGWLRLNQIHAPCMLPCHPVTFALHPLLIGSFGSRRSGAALHCVVAGSRAVHLQALLRSCAVCSGLPVSWRTRNESLANYCVCVLAGRRPLQARHYVML